MASKLFDAIRNLCPRIPSWHSPFPWVSKTILYLRQAFCPVADGKCFQGSIRVKKENYLWLTEDKMAVVNLLLITFKMNDLMTVHYKNNAFNQEIWFCGMQNKIKSIQKGFRQNIYKHSS